MRAREAINGPPSITYHLIPWMCQRLIESIPNTKAIWTSTNDGKFQQIFVAYGCSIAGFLNGCRPILFLDACFLSGPYPGNVFCASAYDADDGLYSVAYAVVPLENGEDWLWFLQNLKALSKAVLLCWLATAILLCLKVLSTCLAGIVIHGVSVTSRRTLSLLQLVKV